jgi:hypothetical protein
MVKRQTTKDGDAEFVSLFILLFGAWDEEEAAEGG